MGYRPQRQLVELDFSDTEHAGLEVTTKRISVDGLMSFVDLLDKAESLDPKAFKADDLAMVGDLFGRFAAVLVSWNVEDDEGQAVPATREGLMAQDFDFAMFVITAWFVAISKAPPPLPSGSSGGGPPPEASLPMEPLPASPPS